MSRANVINAYCFTCGAEDVGSRHVCPDPVVLNPQPPPKPFVKRWDDASGSWCHCMVENGKAWCPRAQSYTEVQPGEELTSPLPQSAEVAP
jgi:hypothetical protein